MNALTNALMVAKLRREALSKVKAGVRVGPLWRAPEMRAYFIDALVGTLRASPEATDGFTIGRTLHRLVTGKFLRYTWVLHLATPTCLACNQPSIVRVGWRG